ncbi:junctional adhesion molecule A-like [Tenebrio molitor]|uniref:junctional adhesion molecule A-like n=1 Tax=Tenebrio molitor TaxID=7067 RepID=UPI001C3A4E13|nr:unnamed protein product [Tenebrio molitor]
MFWLRLFCSVLFFLAEESSSLKSVRIRVPEVVKSGETVTLSCEYDLEKVALYSYKWYWNEVEFYRFVPKESPPFRAFTMKYINVDISRSGPTQVTLRGVRRELTGYYKCEVSADGPLFHTDMKVAHMIVAELPNGNPMMNIEQTKVEIGKKIKADCYSPGSDPPANLTWYINDEQITEENESVKLHPIEIETDSALGLHSSKSRIEITANRAHFIFGLMVVKCEAKIYTLWQKVVEDHVRDDTPQLAPVLGSTSSQSQVDEIIGGNGSGQPGLSITSAINFLLVLIVVLLLR